MADRAVSDSSGDRGLEGCGNRAFLRGWQGPGGHSEALPQITEGHVRQTRILTPPGQEEETEWGNELWALVQTRWLTGRKSSCL